MGIRSFLAFELPVDIKGVVSRVSEDMRKSPLEVKWISPNRIHLTVVFLGNISEEHVEPMGQIAEEICRVHEPFNIHLNGMGIFSSRRNPRVIWIGLDGDLERMATFRDDLVHGLIPFGIKEELRKFSPHLTLGRFRKGSPADHSLDELLTKYRDLSSVECKLMELILFKSDLKPRGPVYTRLDAWPLGEAH